MDYEKVRALIRLIREEGGTTANRDSINALCEQIEKELPPSKEALSNAFSQKGSASIHPAGKRREDPPRSR
jgi:hypothetical protein